MLSLPPSPLPPLLESDIAGGRARGDRDGFCWAIPFCRCPCLEMPSEDASEGDDCAPLAEELSAMDPGIGPGAAATLKVVMSLAAR